MKTVKIRLTDGNEGDVSLDIARNLIGNGHAVAVGAPELVDSGGGESVYSPPQFDPSAHNVDEVAAQLVTYADNLEEVARIQQAERAGKNRKTLTDAWDEQGTDEDSGTA